MLFSLIVSLIVAAILIQVAVFSTTIYLHRTATHKALELHPAVVFGFKFALWLTTGLSTKEWVAVHRKHHAFTDEEGDPHSPRSKGSGTSSSETFSTTSVRRTNPETLERYARDIEEGWWDRNVFKLGLLGLGTRHDVAVRRCIGLLVGGCLPPAFTPSCMSSCCHRPSTVSVITSGYRNFDNTATNIRLIALLTGGEGLHNNHHGYPRSPKFSWRKSGRGEIDPAWPVIKLLIALHLAKPYKTIEEVAA